MHQFNEHHPELKGFSDYFQREVFPFLDSAEQDRKLALKKAVKYCGLLSAAAAVLAVVLVVKNSHGKFLPHIIIFSIVLVAALYKYILKDVSSFTKQQIVGGICSYVGWSFKDEPPRPVLNHWSSLRLIPSGYEALRHSGMKVGVEDEISGEAHGAAFKSTEVKLTRKSGKNTVTDFAGQLMSITFPRKFLGRTIVLRDKGFLQGKTKGDMKRVGLVDPVFEKIFEAYGTDQVEARYLLTPVFMQTLVDLESSLGGKNIRFGFNHNQLFIAVETPNQFEAGSMLEPLTDPARTQKILDEIGAVYDVVDIVSRAKRG